MQMLETTKMATLKITANKPRFDCIRNKDNRKEKKANNIAD